MHRIWISLVEGVTLKGLVCEDVQALLARHSCAGTFEHCGRVAAEAKELARRWGVESVQAEMAGWLHDVSAIVPPKRRLAVAEALGFEILDAERQAPAILHQKLSAAIAADVLGVDDRSILNAVGCHTTLKANAVALDKVVFIADKIAWDQAGMPPYLPQVCDALERSLDLAVYRYLDHLWAQRERLAVIHPWFVEAYDQLGRRLMSRVQER